MTEEGLKRIAELFANDIDELNFTKDDLLQKVKVKPKICGNKIIITLKIAREETGMLDNFKLLGKNGLVYANKILQFQKSNDEVIIEFPFVIINERDDI